MAECWDENHDVGGSTSDESYHFERLHIEPIYDAFICPLTKQVMRDPVSLENGQTFEREAIEKWFKECKDNGRNPVCPLTQRELRSTELNPSMALRNTIEEWNARNEAAQLDMARRSLSPGNAETDILRALHFLMHYCQKSRSNRHVIRNAELIPMVIDMLRSSSRRVRCKALETLRVMVEDDDDNKEILAEGDTVRTIVKFLFHEQYKEREEAVSLLFELSKSETLCEKMGSINGAILILVGLASSKSENVATIENAEKTLENLEKCERNVRQMAEIGRLQPLLTVLHEGSSETKLSMAAFLGELVLNNDVKVLVARNAGSSLIDIIKYSNREGREAGLKALNQISSYEVSAKILIGAGILPPLVKDLFSVGANALPMRLKEVAATILANIVNSGNDFDSVPVGPEHQTLVSEDVIHNFLHLISNTGPTIACKLLQVLVGLTSSPTTVFNVVSGVKNSGATVSLVQFVEAPQNDLRLASIKLLRNLSPYIGQELASCLRNSSAPLSSLIKVISESIGGISEEQAAAVGFLADLPERDMAITKLMLDEKLFQLVTLRIVGIRQGDTRGSRFVTPYLEGLVKVLARFTFVLSNEPDVLELCREYNVAALFIDLLQTNGLDNVQMVSATALENLSQESKKLTNLPDLPKAGFCASIFPCLTRPPVVTGLCRVHHGTCSLKESFCLVEGQAVEKLVSLLDHNNEKVVEAALAALSSLLDDEVDIEKGVEVLCEAEGLNPILDVLLEKRTENLKRRAVWVVERLVRNDELAFRISGDPNATTALVDAFQHGDYRTRQIAERALKHIDKIPNFSGVFLNIPH
ncbi:U-box domain-containing protein 44-like [Ipomoea triloba]|uniref:U-box domain-containing protein 44-like n=1 Tax=Ipomoea triloba TaxID=35885 RepID=UPI00125CEE75|nr:U-box domain-containing protein 44-like [Ipomoea triloba]XP_031130990.1 U-box domain-containing protein 44-like [Ipomoea triloba]